MFPARIRGGKLGIYRCLRASRCTKVRSKFTIRYPMPSLAPMPPVVLANHDLVEFGAQWTANGQRLSRTPPFSSMQLGNLANTAVAASLAAMLGGVPIVPPINSNSLLPPQQDCVELGEIRIVGGIRPQNFDVGYRPDGVRFAFDSKTLNDLKSVGKNYQNMINDLATEAATVHTRFPYAVVGFMVVIPSPCLVEPQRSALVGRLEGLNRRVSIDEPAHLAEAIALVAWSPATGLIDPAVPVNGSSIRIEGFSGRVQAAYFNRYQGMPPHV